MMLFGVSALPPHLIENTGRQHEGARRQIRNRRHRNLGTMKEVRRDIYVLKSGREVAIYRGIIGIDGSGNLYEGYDSALHKPPRHRTEVQYGWDHSPPMQLTPEERIELADEAIERWRRVREEALSELK